jgi:23S rRNA pseudouridine1911/1915/1917 synthase
LSGPSGSVLSPFVHTVSPEEAGRTLASLLRQVLPELSWRRARQLCAEGRVRVAGQTAADPVRRLAAGEEVTLAGAAAQHEQGGGGAPVPERSRRVGPVRIVHLDPDLVVASKPSGLLTVPFERDDRDTLLALTRVALRRQEKAEGKSGAPTLRAVQRLDKETSGLVVFARTLAAQRDLQAQLAEHAVERRYLALVHGEAGAANFDTLLVADRGDGLKGSWGVDFSGPGGGGRGGRARRARSGPPVEAKRAVTRVAVVERLRGATLVACDLETGRQHQIRIHLAEAGHPVLGETVYVRDYPGTWIAAPRLMLHAAVLGFLHPRSGRRVRCEDPLPADFQALLQRLRAGSRGGRAGRVDRADRADRRQGER